VRYEVLMDVAMKSSVFSAAAPCSLVTVYQTKECNITEDSIRHSNSKFVTRVRPVHGNISLQVKKKI
jgi:hypothetical protein